MPVTADEKAERKKTVASGKLKIGDSGESETAQKRKVISREGNTEAGGSQVKKVKTRNKNETEKGAVGTTRVLRSNSAKKGGEAGKEAIMPSAAKESTSKRATRVGASRQVALQKNVKGKNILKRNEAEEASNDEDMHISGKKKKDSLTIGSSKPKKIPPAKKEVPLTIGSPKPRENLQAEPSKRTTRRVGKSSEALSQESAGGSTAVASSSKTVGKQVSKAEKKKGGVPASTPSRKNPPRKGRAAAKTECSLKWGIFGHSHQMLEDQLTTNFDSYHL
ncbi:hypothetical protein DCAR_0310248 [Daucus carota subsp. sativus]|uniref:Uncharacterized protein n=1 Tax=Daucus carota subsp. sativus TaxID=79200 RepID=A0AAF0WN49_DAUCS|nr:hypothetical protein DCAR_0310248 [Daucus carota subsp. sativus]